MTSYFRCKAVAITCVRWLQASLKLQLQKQVVENEHMKAILAATDTYTEIPLTPGAALTRVKVVQEVMFDGAWAGRKMSACGYGSWMMAVTQPDGSVKHELFARHLCQSTCGGCASIMREQRNRVHARTMAECEETDGHCPDLNVIGHMAAGYRTMTRMTGVGAPGALLSCDRRA